MWITFFAHKPGLTPYALDNLHRVKWAPVHSIFQNLSIIPTLSYRYRQVKDRVCTKVLLNRFSFAVKGLLVLLMMSPAFSQAQTVNLWQVFEKVTFRDTYVKEFRDILPVPQFDAAIQSWEGKEISLTGYVIPATEAPGFTWIILSRFSFANCFFCGKAGVESIAEIQMKGKRPFFKNDKLYTFKGRLKLNKDDWEHLHFILEDAVLVK